MTQFFLSNSQIQIQISSHGAELQSLKKGETEYLYQKTPGFWQRQSPVLFPIVGALKDGKYLYHGKEYFLSQHGFARDKDFECVSDKVGESITFSLASDVSTHEKYPFNFELSITYRLIQNSLRVEYSVKNRGISEMFFSLGGHPAFSLSSDISEYSIRFNEENSLVIYRLIDGILSETYKNVQLKNHFLPISDILFGEDAMIFRSIQSKQVEIWKNTEKILSFDRGNFPHFAIWKQVGAPFLCLEPWQGYADSHDASGKIEVKEGIVSLSRGEEKSFWWNLTIEE